MKVAFYKARYGNWIDRAISVRTLSCYSHCELVFHGGVWFSSSLRDKGVRFADIDSRSGHWDFVDIPMAGRVETDIRQWCADKAAENKGYDLNGALRFVIPFVRHNKDRWFCSEICLTALQRANMHRKWNPRHVSPGGLHSILTRPR